MKESYFFRVGDIEYNLSEIQQNNSDEFYHQYHQYLKDLSLENRMLVALKHDDKSLIAIIIGDRIRYPFSDKLGVYEFVVIEKDIASSKTKLADEMSIQHAIHYLEKKYNEQ